MTTFNGNEVIAQAGLIIMQSNGKTVNIQGEGHLLKDDGKPLSNISINRPKEESNYPRKQQSGGYQGKPENNKKHVNFRKKDGDKDQSHTPNA